MLSSKERGEGYLDTARTKALSDGVFAIVITLLILNVKVPDDLGDEVTNGQLLDALGGQWRTYASFLLSFAVVGVYWVAHNYLFDWIISRMDRTLLWLNNLHMLCLVFVPFSAAILGSFGYVQLGVVIYGLNLILCASSLFALLQYALGNRRLTVADLDIRIVTVFRRRTIASISVYGIALALSFANPLISIGVYVCVPIIYMLPSSTDHLWLLRRRTVTRDEYIAQEQHQPEAAPAADGQAAPHRERRPDNG